LVLASFTEPVIFLCAIADAEKRRTAKKAMPTFDRFLFLIASILRKFAVNNNSKLPIYFIQTIAMLIFDNKW
jgi:hypothetical protein